MKLRLAFGVLAQLEPRALLIDEVIAVGDLRFQAKCIGRIRELHERGTALLLASHALDQVAGERERTVWLQSGGVRLARESTSASTSRDGSPPTTSTGRPTRFGWSARAAARA
jgi:ABC-type polysaccharide/polyol phosphate transport system ATPase subunit